MILIRFIIISVAILYIVRSLARVFLPMLFENMVNKAQQQQNQQYRNAEKKDGRVKIDHIPDENRKGKIPDSEGEFIDYEEIK